MCVCIYIYIIRKKKIIVDYYPIENRSLSHPIPIPISRGPWRPWSLHHLLRRPSDPSQRRVGSGVGSVLPRPRRGALEDQRRGGHEKRAAGDGRLRTSGGGWENPWKTHGKTHGKTMIFMILGDLVVQNHGKIGGRRMKLEIGYKGLKRIGSIETHVTP